MGTHRHLSVDSRTAMDQLSSRNKSIQRHNHSDSLNGSIKLRTNEQDDGDYQSSYSGNDYEESDSQGFNGYNEISGHNYNDHYHASGSHYYLESSPSHPIEKHKSKKKKRLDLAYLYADPLMEKNKSGALVPINQPLDTDKELREIQKIIQISKKAFVMRKEAINFESLKQVLIQRPRIIHISCHGDYDDTEHQFYLAFEEKDKGIMDKLTEERLKKLLGEDAQHKVQLAFVSACHSEMIGKIFLRAKIPVVVAVNQHSLILDDVCQLFSRHFYHHLLEGFTPQSAFTSAQQVVEGSNIEKYSCCCAHDHTPDCRWQKYALKYGYEKAHEIHTPSCKCTFEQNFHMKNCSYTQQFNEDLSEFETKREITYDELLEIDIDEDDLPDMDNAKIKMEQICCCQPKLPHNESIKFMLNGTEEAKNTIIFKNRGDGQMLLDQDVNQHNKLPQIIDSQMLVGRNKELQQVVQFLFDGEASKRLIHIYGSNGVGKSAIAKYAAKYTLDRRRFTDGVYYVEVSNQASGKGLVTKICQKLSLPICNKEQLCDIIKNSHLLIILDRCKNIFEQSKPQINKTLKELIVNTTYAKILIVSTEKDDIMDEVRFKVQIQINELSKFNAAKLLLMAAGQSKHLKHHQNAKELSQHPIFNHITFKPTGILQMAPLLFEKSLDEIVRQKERELQKEKEIKKQQEEMSGNNKLSASHLKQYGEFDWIMAISYRDLQSKFSIELNLLYLLCQAPGGLTQTDIEFICTEKPQIYGDYLKFINAIISDDPTKQQSNDVADKKLLQQAQPPLKTVKDQYKAFRLVISNYCDELFESHYMPQPIVSEYINSSILNVQKKNEIFQESFRYMAKLSRRLLRSIKLQKKREIDIQLVSAELDLGIWNDQFASVPVADKILLQQLIDNAELRFGYSEINFMNYLNIDILKENFTKLDFNNVYSQYLDELCVNIPSILIMLDRNDDAIALIDKCKHICNGYNMRYCKAKLILIKVSLLLKTHNKNNEIERLLDQAQSIFMDLSLNEGTAEALYLKALNLIYMINDSNYQHHHQISHHVSFKEQYSFSGLNAGSHTNLLSPHLLERSSSVEALLESQQKRFKPLINYSQTPSHKLSDHNQLLQKNMPSISNQIENVLQYLAKARKFFTSSNREFGIAKTNLIEAEFQVQNSVRIGMLFEYDPKKISNMLTDAIGVFKLNNCKSLKARCLQNLAELEYNMNDCLHAKTHIEKALRIVKKIQDKHQEALYNTILNKILHKISIQSHNVFIFIKAFPQVEILNNKSARVVGTFTRYPTDFRNRIHNELKKQKKVVNVKFDNLTRVELEQVRAYGCRVLHISSDVYNPDYLCIEGRHCEIEYINVDEIVKILRPENGRLNVDVVVIAIPESAKIAQAFVKLGVPHVIAFDIKAQLMSTFMDNVYALPKRYDYIYDFCVEFYTNIVQEHTVLKAWQLAKPSVNNGIRKINDSLGNEGTFLTKEDVGVGPLLLPSNQNHNVKIFSSVSDDEKMQLKSGSFLDSSKVRGPTNVIKQSTPYTGRQVEIYKLMSELMKKQIKLCNVVGIEGIGKTRYLQELSYFMSSRSIFQDGIFMLDLRRLKTSEQIRQKLKEINIGGGQSLDIKTNLQKKDILLIFDNADSLLKHNKTQFDWWLMSLVQQQENLKVIVTTKKAIDPKCYQKLEKQIYILQLKPLNDIEAVDMILSQCSREISKDELMMSDSSKTSVHHQLQQESSVKKCYGFPKYLQIFAQYLKYHSFDKIDIKEKIPNTKRGQMKRLQKNQHLNYNHNTEAIPNLPLKPESIKKNNQQQIAYSKNTAALKYSPQQNASADEDLLDNNEEDTNNQVALLAKQLNKLKMEKRTKSKVETAVIEEEEEEFTESTKTLSKPISKKHYTNDDEEEKKESHHNSDSQYKDDDINFFNYSGLTGSNHDNNNNSNRRKSSKQQVMYVNEFDRQMGRYQAQKSSSEGENNDNAATIMVSYVKKSGIVKSFDMKGSIHPQYPNASGKIHPNNGANSSNTPHPSLYWSQSGETSNVVNNANNHLGYNESGGEGNNGMRRISYLKQMKQDLSQSIYERDKNQLQYEQYKNRKEIDDHFKLDDLRMSEIDKIELEFPTLKRDESTTSQAYDNYSEQRDRSNSEAEKSQSLRDSQFNASQQKSLYNNNRPPAQGAQHQPNWFLTQSEYQTQQNQNFRFDDSLKQFKDEKINRMGVPSKQKSSNTQNNNFQSNMADKGSMMAPTLDELNMSSNEKQAFDLGRAVSVHSEVFDEEDSNLSGEEEDPFDLEESRVPSQSQTLVSRQSSMFTSTSGSLSKDSNFHKSNTKEDKILKEKLKARQEFGSRTGRNQRKYQKQAKNKYKQANEAKLESKKQKKANEKSLKQELVKKRQSSNILNQPDESFEQNQNEHTTSPQMGESGGPGVVKQGNAKTREEQKQMQQKNTSQNDSTGKSSNKQNGQFGTPKKKENKRKRQSKQDWDLKPF